MPNFNLTEHKILLHLRSTYNMKLKITLN